MKLNYIKLIVVLALFCLSVSNNYAGPRTKLGTMAAPELLIPLGSISTSLQGSNLSSITGVDAMYWNPAGISQISSNHGEFMASYMNYFADMKMEYIAGAFKLGNFGVLGASIRNLDFGTGIQVTTETSPEGTGARVALGGRALHCFGEQSPANRGRFPRQAAPRHVNRTATPARV